MAGEIREVTLHLDSSYEAKVETYRDFEESFFCHLYNDAASMIKEILDRNIRSRKKEGEGVSGPKCNIITFIGERGKGKTSAMLSFCSFLKDFNRLDMKEGHSACGVLRDYRQKAAFTVLDCIDATLLESEEKIVDIILGRMFNTMDSIGGIAGSLDWQELELGVRSLQKQCGDIYKALHVKEDKLLDEPDVVSLKEANKTWTQKEAFRELVNQYNDFMKKKNGGATENYLVIPIDDIDMNVAHCYEMLEALRKFLMVENVIILLAVNYKQLECACQNYYFKNIIYTKVKDPEIVRLQTERALGLAGEYLEKIIPTGRKVYMPDLYKEEGFFDNHVKVCVKEGRGESVGMKIQDYILCSIRRFLLVPENGFGACHFLLPSTLRKLSNYIKEFDNLRPLTGEGTEVMEAYRHNARWFYNDITNRFIEQNVDIRNEDILDAFLDYRTENILNIIGDVLLENVSTFDRYENMYYDTSTLKAVDPLEMIQWRRKDTKNDEENFGYGEILFILYHLEQGGDDKLEYIHAIRLLLSLTVTRMLFSVNELGKLQKEEMRMMKDSLENFTQKDYWGYWDDVYFNRKIRKDFVRYAKLEGEVTNGLVCRVELEDVTGEENEEKNIHNIKARIKTYIAVRMFLKKRYGKMQDIDSSQPSEVQADTRLDAMGGNTFNLRLPEGYIWKYRFGNFIDSIYNYDSWLPEVEKEAIGQMRGQLRGRKDYEELGRKMEKMYEQEVQEFQDRMDAWKEKYGTAMVIPAYSGEIMNALFGELYGGNGQLRYTDTERLFKKGIRKAFGVIRQTLEKYDAYFDRNRVLLTEDEKESQWHKYSYTDIFLECPLIDYMMDEECNNLVGEGLYRIASDILTYNYTPAYALGDIQDSEA